MSPDRRSHIRSAAAPARADFVRDAFCGFGGLALASLLAGASRAGGPTNPLAAKPPHRPAKAKSVIFLFMAGGPSHLETFDPKPLLNELDGQPRPAEFGEAKYQFIDSDARLLGTKRTFQKHGQSGIEVSDLFPHTAKCIDDIAVIRSCHGDMVVHSAAQYELFTGRIVPGFPSMGSWMLYGLGSREPVAAGVRRDARSARALWKPASRCTCTASCRPSISRRCSAPASGRCSISTCRPASIRGSGKQTVDLIRELNEATLDPADERAARPGSAPTTWPSGCRPRRRRCSTCRARRRRRSTCTASAANRRTTTAGAACWPASWSSRACGSSCVVSGGGPGNMQWDAHNDIEENHLRKAAETDQARRGAADRSQAPRPARTARSSCGAASSAARPKRRRARARPSQPRLHHVAGRRRRAGAARSSARPTPSACRRSRSPITSATFTPRSCTNSASTSTSSPIPHLGRDERLTFVEGRVIDEIL